ncbi:MAG: hypothetical protein M0R48_10955 [Candidatus Omnitrophica bacterium]|nr:hypothetical protein [Candidatus Omnitrophota bacterium]
MPTTEMILGAKYVHDKFNDVMKIESASTEELDDWVTMISPEDFSKRGFVRTWRGTCKDFHKQWTMLNQE